MRVISSDPVWYTIIHRKKGNSRMYRCGYRSKNLAEIMEIAENEVASGNYAYARVENADTNEIIRIFANTRRLKEKYGVAV